MYKNNESRVRNTTNALAVLIEIYLHEKDKKAQKHLENALAEINNALKRWSTLKQINRAVSARRCAQCGMINRSLMRLLESGRKYTKWHKTLKHHMKSCCMR